MIGEALKLIKYNCPNFRNGSIMSINDVDEKPKFIYNGKEYLFFEKKGIKPKYFDILKNKIKSSRILSQNFRGHLYIQFKITSNDSLELKINGVNGADSILTAVLNGMKSGGVDGANNVIMNSYINETNGGVMDRRYFEAQAFIYGRSITPEQASQELIKLGLKK